MPDLYSSALGANARKVLTTSDVTGPETTWLMITNSDDSFEAGSSYTPQLTTSDSANYRAIVECIQQFCEVYEVVRPSDSLLGIKVRYSSVPYATGEARNDEGENSILTGIVQAHPDLGANFTVYNGSFQDDDINFDD
jgi:hypothetical protein